jgi:hypothetical protein
MASACHNCWRTHDELPHLFYYMTLSSRHANPLFGRVVGKLFSLPYISSILQQTNDHTSKTEDD